MASPGTRRPSIFLKKRLIAILQSVFIFTVCSPRAIHANNHDHEEELCPFGASVDLTSAIANATGFLAESGDFFPSNTTEKRDSVQYGCICNIKPCLLVCPSDNGTENSKTLVPHGYVNYSAIPKVYTTNLTIDVDEESPSSQQRFHILVRKPCPDTRAYSLEPGRYPNDKFYLLRNGSLFLPRINYSDLQFIESNQYCLRLNTSDNNSSYIPEACSPSFSGAASEGTVSSCLESETDDFRTATYICALVDVPFLVGTVIVYSILPELKNIHGNTLRCYLCCLIITYVALGIRQIPQPADCTNASTFHIFLGLTIYFFFLATFFWLNVMCVDMWWSFGGSGSFRNSKAEHDRKKFVGYSIYAWGFPALFTAICIGMEFSPGIPESLIRPGFESGWFTSTAAANLYLFGAVGVIIACNICLFISTSIKIFLHEKNIKRYLNRGDSGRHDENKQRFSLYLKLFILMGISWSTEIVAWLWKEPKYLWYLTDMVNALHGILIFSIFVYKKSTRTSLGQYYKNKKEELCLPRRQLPLFK